jgi:hypothetical protein
LVHTLVTLVGIVSGYGLREREQDTGASNSQFR